MRWTNVLVALTLAWSAPSAEAARQKLLKNDLLRVVSPAGRKPALAHPHVNVIVLFGTLSDGTPAEPSTFRARIRSKDVTERFTPIMNDRGVQTGVRATLEPPMIKLCRRPCNLLRLSVQTKKGPHGKGAASKVSRIRDVDRVRFGAEDSPDNPPIAEADADTEIIFPGIAVEFTGSKGSSDPDLDEISYLWDFGDGATSTAADPQHEFDGQTGDVTVTLTVSDGQKSATDTVALESVPALDDGRTPGTLRVESTGTLEFASVAVGASSTKTLTIKNTDETATSQVKLRIKSANPSFTLSATALALDPGQSQDVTLTFAPLAAGHQSTRVGLVVNASNRQSVSFVAHGFGGSAPDNGPTFAADPLFFTEVAPGLLGLGTFGYMPDGRRFFADNGVNTCTVPGNGLGSGDFCVVNADCSANGGTCATSSTCVSGNNAGQPCSLPEDCPASFCPSYTLFDPVDLCSDGSSLFLLSDEGTFTDPDYLSAETERAVTVMRLDLDPNGNVTKRQILDRTTTETAHMACDGFPSGQGGLLYVPEFHNVPDQAACFRSEREALVRINKATGNTQVVTGFTRIDIAEGLGDCDDLDPVEQLEVTRDGARMFAAFEGGSTATSGGLWQIRPTSIWFSPDITDTFQIHPDGSALFAAATDSGSTGLVNLYRITAGQVEHGALPYSALVPCASFKVPNNGGRTVVIGFGADRDAVGSENAIGLVSFVASAPGLSEVVSSSLLVRGTVAFSAPPNTTTCSVLGPINLEALELAF